MQLFRVQGLISTSLGRVFCAKSTSTPETRVNLSLPPGMRGMLGVMQLIVTFPPHVKDYNTMCRTTAP